MNKQISLQQSYQIAALIEARTSKKQIAEIIGFSKRILLKTNRRCWIFCYAMLHKIPVWREGIMGGKNVF